LHVENLCVVLVIVHKNYEDDGNSDKYLVRCVKSIGRLTKVATESCATWRSGTPRRDACRHVAVESTWCAVCWRHLDRHGCWRTIHTHAIYNTHWMIGGQAASFIRPTTLNAPVFETDDKPRNSYSKIRGSSAGSILKTRA